MCACEMVIKLKSMLVRQKCEWQCVGRLKEMVSIARDMREVIKFICQLTCLLEQSDLSSAMGGHVSKSYHHDKGRKWCPDLAHFCRNQSDSSQCWNMDGTSDTVSYGSLRVISPCPLLNDVTVNHSPSELTISLSLDFGQDDADDNDCDRRRSKKEERRSRRRRQERDYDHVRSPDGSKSDSDILENRRTGFDWSARSSGKRRCGSQPPPDRRRVCGDAKASRHSRHRDHCPSQQGSGARCCCRRCSSSAPTQRPCSFKKDGKVVSKQGCSPVPRRRIIITTDCVDGSEESVDRCDRHERTTSRATRGYKKKCPSRCKSKCERGTEKQGRKESEDVVHRLARESAAEGRARQSRLSSKSSSNSPPHARRKVDTQGSSVRRSAVTKERRHPTSSKVQRVSSKSHRHKSHHTGKQQILSDIEESEIEHSVIRHRSNERDGKSEGHVRHSSNHQSFRNTQNSACYDIDFDRSMSSLNDYLAMTWSHSSSDLSQATHLLPDSDLTSSSSCTALITGHNQQDCIRFSSDACSDTFGLPTTPRCGGRFASDNSTSGESKQPLIISSHETEMNFELPELISLRTREVETLHPVSCGCLICRGGNNNYLRCGKALQGVEIWGSDTKACLERKMVLCLKNEFPLEGASCKRDGSLQASHERRRHDDDDDDEEEEDGFSEEEVRHSQGRKSSASKGSLGQGYLEERGGEDGDETSYGHNETTSIKTEVLSEQDNGEEEDTMAIKEEICDGDGVQGSLNYYSSEGSSQSDESLSKHLKREHESGPTNASERRSSKGRWSPVNVKREPSSAEYSECESESSKMLQLPKPRQPTVMSQPPHDREPTVMSQPPQDREPTVMSQPPQDKESSVMSQPPQDREPTVMSQPPQDRESSVRPQPPQNRESSVRPQPPQNRESRESVPPAHGSESGLVASARPSGRSSLAGAQNLDVLSTVPARGSFLTPTATPAASRYTTADAADFNNLSARGANLFARSSAGSTDADGSEEGVKDDFFRRWWWYILMLLLNLYILHLIWCAMTGPDCSTCHAIFPSVFMNVINMATRSVRLVHYSPAPF